MLATAAGQFLGDTLGHAHVIGQIWRLICCLELWIHTEAVTWMGLLCEERSSSANNIRPGLAQPDRGNGSLGRVASASGVHN